MSKVQIACLIILGACAVAQLASFVWLAVVEAKCRKAIEKEMRGRGRF